jgi:predicted aspartyl protease
MGALGQASLPTCSDWRTMCKPALCWPLLVWAVCLFTGSPAWAEFYKYIDKAGKLHYVDEIWKIPEEYREQAGRYREKYDHLPEGQREEVIAADQKRRQTLEIEQQRQTERQLQDLIQQQKAEQLQQAEAEMERQRKAAETPVTIADNQILVPVIFINSGVETTVQLVMDTGATHTVLYRPVAAKLNVLTLSKGQSKIAGGQLVQSEVGKVDSLRLGPVEARDFPVVIMPFEGSPQPYDGLLGMNFLRRVEYSIDYDKSVIRWKLRSR